jgi:hypothetical protein
MEQDTTRSVEGDTATHPPTLKGAIEISDFNALDEYKYQPILLRIQDPTGGSYLECGVLIDMGDEGSEYRFYNQYVDQSSFKELGDYGATAIERELEEVSRGSSLRSKKIRIKHDLTNAFPGQKIYAMVDIEGGKPIDMNAHPNPWRHIISLEGRDRFRIFRLEIVEGLPFEMQVLISELYAWGERAARDLKEFAQKKSEGCNFRVHDLTGSTLTHEIRPLQKRLHQLLDDPKSGLSPEKKGELRAFAEELIQKVEGLLKQYKELNSFQATREEYARHLLLSSAIIPNP